MKIHLPASTFILLYVRAKIIDCACMGVIELDQRETIDIHEKYVFKVSGELFSCGITYSGRVTV